MKELSYWIVLDRYSKNADLTKIAAYFRGGMSLSKPRVRCLLADLPRVVCEVSSRNEGELLQASLDELGAITQIKALVTDSNGHFRLFKKHHQLLKKELSKILRGRTRLALFLIHLITEDPDALLPSMMGDFPEKFGAYFRDSDTAIGIDEEQILLLGFTTDRKGAFLVQNRIKRAIHELLPVPLQVTVGFSIFPDEGRSITSLFQKARTVEDTNERTEPVAIRPAPSEQLAGVSVQARNQQRIGTIQLYFARARGRLFQRLQQLDAKALWHGLSQLSKKEQQGFLNRLPYDYKLAPTLEKIINSNPRAVSNRQLEKHLEGVIFSMTLDEGLEDRKRNAARIAARLTDIEALPVLPGVAMKLFNILADPDSMIDELAAVIETDPSLTLKLLKLVNSAFYGFARKIDSVKESVVILGTDEIKNLAFGLSAAKTFQSVQLAGVARPLALWHHSIGTAIIAEYLSKRAPNFTETGVFTAGLIHDTGKIFLMEHFPLLYREVHETASTLGIPVFEMEEEKYELSHGLIGRHVATRWNLPENLSHAMACHHLPSASADAAYLAAIIGFADYLYHRAIQSKSTEEYNPPSYLTFGQFSVLNRLFKGLSDELLETLSREVTTLLADNQDLFTLT